MERKAKTKRQREVIFVEAKPKFKLRIKTVADVLEQDVSQFTRDALAHYVDRLAAENKAVARALRAVA